MPLTALAFSVSPLDKWEAETHGNREVDVIMQIVTSQDHTYKVGHINFIVTPIYRTGQGETVFDILLKLMKADAGHE